MASKPRSYFNSIIGSFTKHFAGQSRMDMLAKNNLGIIRLPMPMYADKRFRSLELEVYDAYYDSRQYNHLDHWDDCEAEKSGYVPIRSRKPRIIIPFSKMLCSRLSAKLVGNSVFPRFTVSEDPETEEYLKYIIKAAKLNSRLLEPIRQVASCGSNFVRFYIVDGSIKVESYAAKYCYPEFDNAGNLKFIKIQYVFEDTEDLDEKGAPKLKWYRMDLGVITDIIYKTLEFSNEKKDPIFEVENQVDHNFGFVQGEWFRTCEKNKKVDGESLVGGILDFIDELNYSISQSSQAIGYNQDPQILINGMDSEELDELIRSASKAWNMGREGKASALETNLNGVKSASEMRDRVNQNIQTIARIVLLDPEKIIGSAQSAKAMEVLHGPLLELIDELRPVIGDSMINLVTKMAIVNLKIAQVGGIPAVSVPKGWAPASLNIEVVWPAIFPATIQDLRDKVQVAASAIMSNIISRETALKFVAKDFGIDNIEEELQKILEQPIFNQFGSSWSTGGVSEGAPEQGGFGG